MRHDVTCRTVVRSFEPEELAVGLAQTMSKVIISPRKIYAAGWPGVSPHIPERLGQVVIAGRVKDIEAVDPIYVRGVLVPIELQVLG